MEWRPWRWKTLWGGWPGKKPAVFFVQMVYLACLGIFVILYRVHEIDPRKDFFGPVPFLVPWFGAVGAVMLSLAGIFYHRADWDTKYSYWHWARPFVGGVIATVGILILQSGILAVGGQIPSHASTETAKNLLYYVFAFVIGYREDVFRSLIERVSDVLLKPGDDVGAQPVIASAKPSSVQGGQARDVAVIGSGFTGTTSVKLGSESVPFIGQSDSQLAVTIPASAPKGPSSLIVKTATGAESVPFEVT